MLSSLGIGSELDISRIISQLMQVEQRPLTQLNTKEAKQQAQLSAFGSLKSALSTSQDSVKALAKPSLFNGFKATLADTTLAAASTSSSVATGTHQIEVQFLAPAQKIKSEAFSTTGTLIGSGSLTIRFGTYNEDGTFTASTEKIAKAITIDSTKSTLTVEKDKNSVETAIKALITPYNELEETIGNLSRYDAANKQASVLTGDSTVRMSRARYAPC